MANIKMITLVLGVGSKLYQYDGMTQLFVCKKYNHPSEGWSWKKSIETRQKQKQPTLPTVFNNRSHQKHNATSENLKLLKFFCDFALQTKS